MKRCVKIQEWGIPKKIIIILFLFCYCCCWICLFYYYFYWCLSPLGNWLAFFSPLGLEQVKEEEKRFYKSSGKQHHWYPNAAFGGGFVLSISPSKAVFLSFLYDIPIAAIPGHASVPHCAPSWNLDWYHWMRCCCRWLLHSYCVFFFLSFCFLDFWYPLLGEKEPGCMWEKESNDIPLDTTRKSLLSSYRCLMMETASRGRFPITVSR